MSLQYCHTNQVVSNLVPRAHVSFGQRLTKRHVGSGNEIAMF